MEATSPHSDSFLKGSGSQISVISSSGSSPVSSADLQSSDSTPISIVLSPQNRQRQDTCSSSTTFSKCNQASALPRDPLSMPEFDFLNYCASRCMTERQLTQKSYYLAADLTVKKWFYFVPQIMFGSIDLASTCALRALLIGYCGKIVKDKRLGVIASNWYITALQRQKTLLDTLSQPGQTQRGKQSIELPLSDCFQLQIHESKSNISAIPSVGNLISTVQDDTLLAGLLLSIYESNACTSGIRGWMNLISGTCNLLEIRGPERCPTEFSKLIYTSVQIPIHAALSKKKSVFASVEWRNSSNIPQPSSTYHCVVDELFKIAEYQEEMNRLYEDAFPLSYLDNYRDSAGCARATPRLRKEHQTAEGWKAAQALHNNLGALSVVLDLYMKDHGANMREFIAKDDKEEIRRAKLDPVTFALLNTKRCSAVKDDAEWKRTHFFKPEATYITGHESKMVIYVFYMKTIISYLQIHTALSAFVSYDFYKASGVGCYKTVIDNYTDQKKRDMQYAYYALMRSARFSIETCGRAQFVAMLLALGDNYEYVLQDSHERGYLWSLVFQTNSMQPAFNFPELNSPNIFMDLGMYQSLGICSGCRERLRPL